MLFSITCKSKHPFLWCSNGVSYTRMNTAMFPGFSLVEWSRLHRSQGAPGAAAAETHHAQADAAGARLPAEPRPPPAGRELHRPGDVGLDLPGGGRARPRNWPRMQLHVHPDVRAGGGVFLPPRRSGAGAETEGQAVRIHCALLGRSFLLSSALCKWCSNRSRILSGRPTPCTQAQNRGNENVFGYIAPSPSSALG